VGTGAHGALPVMDEVLAEAKRRGVEIIAKPTLEACQLLEELKRARPTPSCIVRADRLDTRRFENFPAPMMGFDFDYCHCV
jgi:hypothetical protein